MWTENIHCLLEDKIFRSWRFRLFLIFHLHFFWYQREYLLHSSMSHIRSRSHCAFIYQQKNWNIVFKVSFIVKIRYQSLWRICGLLFNHRLWCCSSIIYDRCSTKDIKVELFQLKTPYIKLFSSIRNILDPSQSFMVGSNPIFFPFSQILNINTAQKGQ